MNLVQRLAAQEEVQFEEGYILELGAGVHNPMGCQLIGLADNAAFCSAIEPGKIVAEHWHHAALVGLLAQHYARRFSKSLQDTIEIIIEMIQEKSHQEEKEENKFSGIHLFNGTIEEYDYEYDFDILHSNAVLEHVSNIELAVQKLYNLTRNGGIHIHKVDFIDHRYYEKKNPTNEDAFRFLLIGQEHELGETNGLRRSEMIRSFVDAGFEFVGAKENWRRPFPESLRPRLQPRYRHLGDGDLSTTCSTLVFKKEV